ncbi:MAG: nicotinate (nicotinamide) nucleotide adenylyltransferase [Deltaproteobacteria bacterium]|nr:MAG: nicotinate (nicotinamide) nucleotide adenylyltransferase [Deltaproteobacteria bacterium]
MERTDPRPRRQDDGGAVTTRRVAIYGGSFDPPHLGHVLSVAWALSAADVDAVWIIPTWKHAFDKEHGASFEQRLSMCKLAFSVFRDVEVSDIEQRLGGVSRTLDTLDALESEHPDAVFRLLIGADVLPTTNRWHRWDEVVKVAPPLVIGRQGSPVPEGCPISIPNINSTDIRSGFAHAADVTGLVPTAVIEHIGSHGLYQGEG